MLGSFGQLIFSVSQGNVLTPKNISRKIGANWASHDLLSGKPRKQFIGAEVQKITLEIVIRADLGHKPRYVLSCLHTMAEEGTAAKLLIGGVPVTKLPLVITAVSDTWDVVYAGGELMQATVTLELEEYQ